MKASRSKILLLLSLLWAFVLSALGGWWLYLIYRFGEQMSAQISHGPNIVSLIKWEGGTFLLLLLFISGTLLYQYLKDQKKGKALQDFFATMTHELKTPLAAVRLQGEVIAEVIKDLSLELKEGQSRRITTLARRLVEDTQKLETQMDKILQLSRVERGVPLSRESIGPISFIFACRDKWAKHLNIDITSTADCKILADGPALELIFRNLFENTLVHASPQTHQSVAIHLEPGSSLATLSYRDGGKFSGDTKKLGTLFYKHASKGSGIGLYLVRQLAKKMGGTFSISQDQEPRLTFTLTLPLAKESS